MKISKNFKSEEFDCRDGTPYPSELIPNLTLLCEDLEIIRAEFCGKAVTITSGYRTPRYNRKIGGAKNSQHILGNAGDLKIAGVPARKVAAKVVELVKTGKLNWIKAVGSYPTFTHVDIRPSQRLIVWKQ